VLREVSLILAEDTRHTRKLLSHHGISTPTLSYHQHNKKTRLEPVLERLCRQDIALVSNAGMPAVSDPGFELIEACRAAGISVDVLPGANAAVTAIVAAALPSRGFLFMGFLPRRNRDRRQRLEEVANLAYSLVLYEAPHRLKSLLSDIHHCLGNRQVILARELSKLHQEVKATRVEELMSAYGETEPKGEITLVIQGAQHEEVDKTGEAREQIRVRKLQGQNARTAVAEVSKDLRLKRNVVYKMWLELADD
jgi:16S rRNA (cytidine1402-2'-O)-methyltransferase